MNPNDLRIPPHCIAAEQSVIGGILLDNQSYLYIAGLLTDTDFYREDHQLIFRAMSEMAENNQAIDVLTVAEWMKGRFVKRGNQQQSFSEIVGGLAYLGDLAKDTPSSANIAAYAHMVSNYSLKRQVIQFALTLVNQGFKQGSDNSELTELLEFMVSNAFALEQKKVAINNDFIPMKQALKQQLKQLEALRDNDGKTLLGASSTLEALDAQLSGFENGKVYVLAGRPAMGKTTLGLNLVEGIASTTGGVVAVFSLEMPTEQIISKMLSSQGRIDFSHLRSPWELSDAEWDSLNNNSVKKLKKMDIFFDDQAAHSPASLRTRCRRLVQRTGKPLSAMLIDYVQLMHGSRHKKYPNRESEVAAISSEIRAMAKDFNCPIILLSQLNRALENRPDKRPQMSDLRESGALEQDASCVIFIYRDEIYHSNSKDKGIAELIVAKHRGGKTGTIRCRFVGEHQRFANHAQTDYIPPKTSYNANQDEAY